MQDFNIVVENAKKMAELKKHIKYTVPHFKGIKKWLTESVSEKYVSKGFNNEMKWNYRFMTLTFDPKKFSKNELSQPIQCITYALNAIYDVRHLFTANPIVVIEYHKSGIPHVHFNYSVKGPLEHATLILRMRYFFAQDLRNTKAVHDRIFNEGGIAYITKSNTDYYTFKIWENFETESFGIKKSLEN